MSEKIKAPITKITKHNRQKVPRIDFEILSNFYRICKKKKISEREIAFLMGKRNKYFVEYLNPFIKDQIKTEFLDILRTIASTSFQQIVPNNVKPKETIDICGTHYTYSDPKKDVTKYNFTVKYMDQTSKGFRWQINVQKGERSKVNEKLLEILKGMVNKNYFDSPKYALTVYLHLKKKYKSKFSALELQVALAKLCNAKADITYALKISKDNMRDVYAKAHPKIIDCSIGNKKSDTDLKAENA